MFIHSVPKLKITAIFNGLLVVDREYTLNGSTTIGRSDKCNIQIDLPGVSRCHCTIVRLTAKRSQKLEYSIIDGCYQGSHLKPSTNGLMVNGEQLESGYLQHGDEIVLIDREQQGKKQFAKAIFLEEDRSSDARYQTQS